MKFRLRQRPDMPASLSPYRVMDESGKSLVRWWSQQPGIDVSQFRAQQFTESTLIDYVRSQLDERPKPGPQNINNRSSMIRRLFRFYFGQEMPHGPYRLQQTRLVRPEWGYDGPGRRAVVADLHIKVPQRVVEPLSQEQAARFWASFDTARSGHRRADVTEWIEITGSVGSASGGSVVERGTDPRAGEGIESPSAPAATGNGADAAQLSAD